jgi:hypothetical protein
MTLSKTTFYNYAECRFAECHVSFVVMLSVIMLNVVAPLKHRYRIVVPRWYSGKTFFVRNLRVFVIS